MHFSGRLASFVTQIDSQIGGAAGRHWPYNSVRVVYLLDSKVVLDAVSRVRHSEVNRNWLCVNVICWAANDQCLEWTVFSQIDKFTPNILARIIDGRFHLWCDNVMFQESLEAYCRFLSALEIFIRDQSAHVIYFLFMLLDVSEIVDLPKRVADICLDF
jgi:hypothetical protein